MMVGVSLHPFTTDGRGVTVLYYEWWCSLLSQMMVGCHCLRLQVMAVVSLSSITNDGGISL